jgi:DNA-binding response OmpR family regulator
VSAALTREGFAVDVFGTRSAGCGALASTPYDAVILDRMLPDGDGLEIVREARASGSAVPILILTARDAIDERVLGLNSGSDDYVIKPFAMRELIARLKALLRRPGQALGTTLMAANMAFDTVEREARVNGSPLLLPRREAAILEHLMRRLGRVVPKSVLEDHLYGTDEELESNAIPVHVHHLRRKLIEAGAEAEIHTVRGIGYLLIELSG